MPGASGQRIRPGGVVERVGKIPIRPSRLRPDVPADERLFRWRGVNRPPHAAMGIPVLQHVADLASRSSLRDAGSYGSALRKFHVFCDTFDIEEEARLPARPEVLHAFALWVACTPDPLDPVFADGTLFEPVSVATARKYISAIQTWHVAQGFPAPLRDEDFARLKFTFRRLNNIDRNRRTKAPRPPFTPRLLDSLRDHLDLASSFDACIWAAATCAFWGMMRFGEVTVKSRAKNGVQADADGLGGGFDGARHLKRRDMVISYDSQGSLYIKLTLPAAKSVPLGETQDVFIPRQHPMLCPLEALSNLARVLGPAHADGPLFAWRDRRGRIRPLRREAALKRINTALAAGGWKPMFGHSFRIGGASYYLSQKVSPEIVRIAGRWRSLAYEAYIWAFEAVVNQHMGGFDVPEGFEPPAGGGWVGGAVDGPR
jgi:hypothetical protein